MSGRAVPACAIVFVLCAAASAAAQGHGNAYGKTKNAKPPATASASGAGGPSAAGAPEIQIPGTGVRNFGAWLDDASMMPVGRGYVSLGFGLWQMPGYREFDVPMIDGGVGLHPRVQVSASLPYYHANEPGGPMARGFGTMYLTAKVQLRDPSSGGAGFSVTPALEVLSVAPEGRSRTSWALPVNVEVQRDGWRVYGSTGYFSRGALFASGAIEKALSDRAWVTGTIVQAYSIHPDPLSVALGLAQTRTDVSGGAAFGVRENVAVFGSLGRTISTQDANSTNLVLTGGVSFNFAVR